MKALLLALLVSTAFSDSIVVDVRGTRGTVGLSQYWPRIMIRQNCEIRRDDWENWWFFEVRGAPLGGKLILYDTKGRAFDMTPPCDVWPMTRIGHRLHGVLGATPDQVDSATYRTPEGTTLTFTRSP